MSLLKRMLELKPKKRPSAQTCLADPSMDVCQHFVGCSRKRSTRSQATKGRKMGKERGNLFDPDKGLLSGHKSHNRKWMLATFQHFRRLVQLSLGVESARVPPMEEETGDSMSTIFLSPCAIMPPLQSPTRPKRALVYHFNALLDKVPQPFPLDTS